MDHLQQQPEVTRTDVSEAIWRLVSSRRVRLTKTLRLRAGDTAAVPPQNT